ncbi:MAG: DUF721 domain-containing protein [Candidatus Eisenbacteria bacterium]|nr:DUF721 domain-containing protein [Candidatus Latescibacterota bacterium]MBD3303155.1 DUF721 domain-containing protein [Candidatus Eisenbacteria bacterium]
MPRDAAPAPRRGDERRREHAAGKPGAVTLSVRTRKAPGWTVRGGAPKPVGDVLQELLRRRGLLQKMEDHRLFADWKRVVGASLADVARPLKIERGILWIGVNSAPMANQLLYLKPQLLARIAESYPAVRVRDLRVLHRPQREERA